MTPITCPQLPPAPTLGWVALATVLGLATLLPLWGCDAKKADPPPRSRPPAKQAPPARLADVVAKKEKALLARLAQHPDDLDAQLALANLYFDSDRPHRAVPAYTEVLKRRDEPNIRTDLGTCYKRMGILDKARAEYERVLRKHPGHIQATYNLAVVSELARDPRRAAELWERVAAMAPGTPIAGASLKHAANARRAARQQATTTTPASSDGAPRP